MKIQKIAKKWLKLPKIYEKNLMAIFLAQILLGLCGSEAAIAVFRPANLDSNPVVGEDLFLIGMIFKLPLGSTYQNTVQWPRGSKSRILIFSLVMTCS